MHKGAGSLPDTAKGDEAFLRLQGLRRRGPRAENARVVCTHLPSYAVRIRTTSARVLALPHHLCGGHHEHDDEDEAYGDATHVPHAPQRSRPTLVMAACPTNPTSGTTVNRGGRCVLLGVLAKVDGLAWLAWAAIFAYRRFESSRFAALLIVTTLV